MTQYQATPDYYRDYIEHGWLKDQVAKAHKYIERWRGKNGKWYYRYYKAKSKMAENRANKYRKKWGIGNEDATLYINKKGGEYAFNKNHWLKSMDNNGRISSSGRPNSRNYYDSGQIGQRTPNITKIGPTRAQRKTKYVDAFKRRQAQLSENKRRTEASVARKKEMNRMRAEFNKMQSDFDKSYARVKKKKK